MILSPYGKGRGDYRKGVRFDANPYTRQIDRDDWERGWMDSRAFWGRTLDEEATDGRRVTG